MKKLLGIAFVGMMALGCGSGSQNPPPASGANPPPAATGADQTAPAGQQPGGTGTTDSTQTPAPPATPQ